MSTTEVRDNASLHRFELVVDGAVAGLVVPLCPFFARYVSDHASYDDIVVS